MISHAPRHCPGCERPVDEASAWCNFCGRATTGGRHLSPLPTAAPARCTPHDLGVLEAALSSQDPARVARALTSQVARARGGKALLPPACRLVLDRSTLTMAGAAALVEATVLGATPNRWRLHLQAEAGGWKLAAMERAAALSKSA